MRAQTILFSVRTTVGFRAGLLGTSYTFYLSENILTVYFPLVLVNVLDTRRPSSE
jgi:hypothetical protein